MEYRVSITVENNYHPTASTDQKTITVRKDRITAANYAEAVKIASAELGSLEKLPLEK